MLTLVAVAQHPRWLGPVERWIIGVHVQVLAGKAPLGPGHDLRLMPALFFDFQRLPQGRGCALEIRRGKEALGLAITGRTVCRLGTLFQTPPGSEVSTSFA